MRQTFRNALAVGCGCRLQDTVVVKVRMRERSLTIAQIAARGWTEAMEMTDLTYMDCWNYIAPLIPISSETSQDIYVMVFQALKEADERRNKND